VAVDPRRLGQLAGVRPHLADPTLEPGKKLTDTWDAPSGHDLSVFGPNGFFRRFKDGHEQLRLRAHYDARDQELILEAANLGSSRLDVSMADQYSGRTATLTPRRGDERTSRWSLSRTHGWYDILVTAQGDPDLEFRFAGHVENGQDSMSDLGMGGLH
jgi:phospholipase C